MKVYNYITQHMCFCGFHFVERNSAVYYRAMTKKSFIRLMCPSCTQCKKVTTTTWKRHFFGGDHNHRNDDACGDSLNQERNGLGVWTEKKIAIGSPNMPKYSNCHILQDHFEFGLRSRGIELLMGVLPQRKTKKIL